MSFIETLGQQVAGQGIGAILGLAMEKHNDKRQIRQQGQLQDMQIAGQKQMIDYSQAKQLEMWKATNFKAQMEQLAKAGLNPGLLYGMGGGGGTTTGQAAGNVTGGQANQNPGEVATMTGMGIQSALAASQIELQKAQADKLRAEIPKVGAETELTQVNTKLQQLSLKLQNETYEESVDTIIAMAHQAKNNTMISDVNTNKARAMSQPEIDAAYAGLTGLLLDNAVKKGQIQQIQQEIKLSQAQINKMGQDILQGWKSLDQDQQKIRIQEAMQKAYGKQVDFNTSQSQRTYDNILRGVNTIANFIPTPKGNITGPTINVNNANQ